MKQEQVKQKVRQAVEHAAPDYSDRLREAAIALLEQTPCERNRIVAGWQACGVEIGNAFDSQAMLELTRLYCGQKRCAECGLGKYLIKRRFA